MADMRSTLTAKIKTLRERIRQLRAEADGLQLRVDNLITLRDGLTDADEARIAQLAAAEALRVSE